jgi:hypothetical protein
MFGAKLMYHAHRSMYATPEFRAFSQLTGNNPEIQIVRRERQNRLGGKTPMGMRFPQGRSHAKTESLPTINAAHRHLKRAAMLAIGTAGSWRLTLPKPGWPLVGEPRPGCFYLGAVVTSCWIAPILGVLGGWSPTRTSHPFWDNFRVDGYSTGARFSELSYCSD